MVEDQSQLQKAAQKEQMAQAAEFMRALAHPVRLCLLQKMLQSGACTVTTFADCLGAAQPTVSQHLSRLRHAGLVRVQQEGVYKYYELSSPLAGKIIKLLNEEEFNET